jgi:hypothetical protein
MLINCAFKRIIPRPKSSPTFHDYLPVSSRKIFQKVIFQKQFLGDDLLAMPISEPASYGCSCLPSKTHE